MRECGHGGEMRNKYLRNWRNGITQGWDFCSLEHLLWKGRKKMKKLLQHGVFVFGHPPRYAPWRTGLNYAERMRHGAVFEVWWPGDSELWYWLGKERAKKWEEWKRELLLQGSHAPWKSLKVLEFENENSRPWKSLKSTLGPWKTLKFAVWLFSLSGRTRKDWDLNKSGSYPLNPNI